MKVFFSRNYNLRFRENYLHLFHLLQQLFKNLYLLFRAILYSYIYVVSGFYIKVCFFQYIFKEVVVQYFGDVNKQFHVDGSSFEDCVNVGSLAVKLPCKFRYAHTASFKNGFDESSDM